MTRARPYDRETALDAATMLFWRKGFVGTSLKDLENALSMKPGSIYAAFNSKEELYSMSLERYFDQNLEALSALKEAGGSLISALSGFLLRIGQNAPGDPLCQPCMVVKTLLEVTSVSAQITEQSRAYLNGMVNEIKSVLDLAQAKGELNADVDTAHLARRYQANLTALRLEAHLSDNPEALVQLAKDMSDELQRHRNQTISK